MAFVNRCIFLPTSGGTGTWTVSSAKPGYLTPAQAGAINATGYKYTAEIRDGAGAITAWEVGSTTYTVAGTTLTRTVLLSSNANTLVNFASPPEIMICVLAEDLNPFPVPVIITDTTETTGLNTGSLQVAGGVAIAKTLKVGADFFTGQILFNAGSSASTSAVVFNKDRDAAVARNYIFFDCGGAATDTTPSFYRGLHLWSPMITDPSGGANVFPIFAMFFEYDTLTAPSIRLFCFDIGNSTATTRHGFSIRNAGNEIFNISEGGLAGTYSATAILKSFTTITGGSTANVPTLTTGPVTGNPTKWLPYNDNGTTRYIPSW